MKTLIVDNYDSFSFNLAQYIGEANGEEALVVKNDEYSFEELLGLGFDNVVISPGPGHPEVAADFGISAELIRRVDTHQYPLLGVCLGFQGIAAAHGAAVRHAPEPIHGRTSFIHHDGRALFDGLPSPFKAVRYHSLAVRAPLCPPLQPTARTGDGLLMGLQHETLPLWGVQFHPESVCTEHGLRLLENFRELSLRWLRRRSPRAVVAWPGRPLSRTLVWRKWACGVDAQTVFTHLHGGGGDAFWLDSSRVVPGLSRFSFMGDVTRPAAQRIDYRQARREISVRSHDGVQTVRGELLDYLRDRLAAAHVAPDPQLPFDFAGGFVGYLGYELKADCGGAAAHVSAMPDASLLYVEDFVAFDHAAGEVYVVATADPARPGEALAWIEATRARIEALRDADADAAAAPPAAGAAGPAAPPLVFTLEMDRSAYLDAIRQCQRKIRDGESYEICLTNRIRARADVDALALYRTVRRRNPAPCSAFLRLGDAAVVCSSPERFLSVGRDRVVQARPIKGTAPRDADPRRDAVAAETLRTSEKNRSENLMIVDLMRNDLGRVSETGSVCVPRLMAIESYATVHQMVSTIEGVLRPGVPALDAVRAAFPGGSMTGAPKVRTMQIIDALEDSARGVYSGAIGFLSRNGTLDLNIVIRTIVVQPGELSIGVGGAIVALSDPIEEFDETLLKGEVLVRAIAEHLGVSADDAIAALRGRAFASPTGTVSLVSEAAAAAAAPTGA